MRGLVQHRPQHGIAGFRNSSVVINLAGLVTPRREPDMGAHRPGMNKALRLVDGCPICQSNHGSDTGYRHEAPANGILADGIGQYFVQLGELAAKHRSNGEERLGDPCQLREPLNQLAYPRFKISLTDDTNLQAEIT